MPAAQLNRLGDMSTVLGTLRITGAAYGVFTL
jgi:hypothetical protein